MIYPGDSYRLREREAEMKRQDRTYRLLKEIHEELISKKREEDYRKAMGDRALKMRWSRRFKR